MNKKEKERFEKILQDKKKENHQKLSKLFHESKTIVEIGGPQDEGDKADISYTKDFLLSLSDSERKQLQLIDEAIQRIEESTYGKCLMCGKDIGMKRLGVVPWTAHCIYCQEKAEEEFS